MPVIGKSQLLILFFYPVAAGLIFWVIGMWGYSEWKAGDYEVRDDGVITLSHARNLAEYNTIGINPAGERVEGFSAPVQMGIYFIFYKVWKVSYDTFAKLQTSVCLFLLGFIIYLFFRDKPWFGFAASAGSALFLTECHSFWGWNGSGMENAITHVLFLFAVLLLYEMYKSGKVKLWYAVVLFVASISRVDSIWHIGPVVLIFVLAWKFRWHTCASCWVGLLFLGLWTIFQLWRYSYFGSLMPNTGIAQSIDVPERLLLLSNLDRPMINDAYEHANNLFAKHNGYLFLLSLPLLFFARKNPDTLFIVSLVLAFCAMSFLSPFVFGRARLDDARTTTHLPLMGILGVTFVLANFNKWHSMLWTIPLLTTLFFAETQIHNKNRKYLCCNVTMFDKWLNEFKTLEKQHDLFRPAIANADLGIISWHKWFNVVDLGYLGSPVIADLRHQPTVLADYFLDFIAPDFAEIHGVWACKHSTIQEDKRFTQRYTPSRSRRGSWLKRHCHSHRTVKSGMWIRKDIMKGAQTRERRLIDALRKELDPALIEHEIELCNTSTKPGACLYVTRTVYRFLPELEAADHMHRIRRALAKTDTANYSLALLDAPHNGRWHFRAVEAVKRFGKRIHHSKIMR